MKLKDKYRPNVAAIIVHERYPFSWKVFIAKRLKNKAAWQFPHGGIDMDETPKQALLRELKEEIGTDQVQIIAEYPHWLSYDFPKKILFP